MTHFQVFMKICKRAFITRRYPKEFIEQMGKAIRLLEHVLKIYNLLRQKKKFHISLGNEREL